MKVKLTDRDCELLGFLWYWKLLSTAALTRGFFCGLSPITAYKRLWKLRKAGYIQVLRSERHGIYVWGLTELGFEVAKCQLLVELKDEGFTSENIRHDFLTSAIHIGDWLKEPLEEDRVFTEQQLRCYHDCHYPEWVPRRFLHRPDGYWRIQSDGEHLTIALEVELERKSAAHYEILAERYEAEAGIFRVVWLVPNEAFGRYVRERIARAVKSKAGIHDFISLKTYEKMGWQSPFFLGYEHGRSLEFLLQSRVITPMKPVSALLLFDGRLCPHKSKSSSVLEKPAKFDRLPLLVSPSLTQTKGADNDNSVIH